MAANELEELIQRAAALSPEERLRLIACLEAMTEEAEKPGQTSYAWKSVCGIASHPMLGEDAQAWISRTRQEGDEQREKQWRRGL